MVGVRVVRGLPRVLVGDCEPDIQLALVDPVDLVDDALDDGIRGRPVRLKELEVGVGGDLDDPEVVHCRRFRRRPLERSLAGKRVGVPGEPTRAAITAVLGADIRFAVDHHYPDGIPGSYLLAGSM